MSRLQQVELHSTGGDFSGLSSAAEVGNMQ